MPAVSDPSMLIASSYYEISSSALNGRSFKDKLKPNDTQKITLIVAGCYVVIIGILWYAQVAFSTWMHADERPLTRPCVQCLAGMYPCWLGFVSSVLVVPLTT